VSFSFDGVDDYTTSSPGNLGAVVSAFLTMNPTSYGENTRAHLFTQGTGVDYNTPRLNFYFGNGHSGWENTLRLECNHATTNGSWKIPYDPAQLGKWQSVAFSLDHSSNANNPTVYFNGQPQAVTRMQGASGAWAADGPAMYYGNSSGLARTHLGQITTIACWTRVLSPSEHALVHYCGVRKVLRGLKFWYRFAQPSGYDYSGAGLNLNGVGVAFVPSAEGDRLATGA
jgi:Concanavalin A-like lectin/glucanases superfamily